MNWSYFHMSTREHHELENNHAISRQNVAECQCQGRLTTEGDTTGFAGPPGLSTKKHLEISTGVMIWSISATNNNLHIGKLAYFPIYGKIF